MKWVFITLCSFVLGYAALAQTIQSTGCTGVCSFTSLILGATGVVSFGGDVGISRDSGGTLDVGNGTQGSKNALLNTGQVQANNYDSYGAVPTTLGSCSFAGFVGGNTAGTFVAQGCGPPATAATAMVLVFGNAAPNGWSCDASDRTSNVAAASAATVQALTQNGSTANAASFRASTLTGDVIQFKCMGY